jgi:hypothetical protein
MRTKQQNYWLACLHRILLLPEPWDRKLEASATNILLEEEKAHKLHDTGWYIRYWEHGTGVWPIAVGPSGKQHDLRKLAGLL